MARPKKVVVTEATIPTEKPTVRVAHLHAGLDLIGSATTMNSTKADIYELPWGLKIISKATKRQVVIPYANIRGYELL